MTDLQSIPVHNDQPLHELGQIKKFGKIRTIILSLVMVGVSIWLWQNGYFPGLSTDKTSSKSTFTLQADKQESDGVDTQSTFTFSASDQISTDQIKKILTVDPPLPYEVQRVTPKKVTIVPAHPLSSQTVYQFAIKNLVPENGLSSWAFQTQGDFRITQTTPRNKATSVGLNSSIELVFSSDQFGDPTKYVEISPAVEGHWEKHFQTAVFLPKALQPLTLYTLKISPDLPLEGTQKTLSKEKIVQFETSQSNRSNEYFNIDRNMSEVSEDEVPEAEVHFSNNLNPDVKVTLYQFASGEQFAQKFENHFSYPSWARTSFEEKKVDTTGLQKNSEFQTTVEKVGDNHTVIRFPESLTKGWYLAEFAASSNENTQHFSQYYWIQSTSLSAYVSISETDSIAWIHDRSQGIAVPQASVKLFGKEKLGDTDQNGLVRFKTPEALIRQSQEWWDAKEVPEPSVHLFELSDKNGQSLYIPSTNSFQNDYWGSYEYQTAPHQQLWTYLHFDKPMYKPRDTVQFWGVLRSRDAQKPNPDHLTAEIYDDNGFGAQPLVGVVPEITVQKDGTFIGKVNLPELRPSNYQLVIKDQDKPVFGQYFDVVTYVKPAYSMELNSNKRAVFKGETFTFSGKANFFEGTPLPKLPVRITSDFLDKDEVKTDTNQLGEFSGQMVGKLSDSSGLPNTSPSTQYISAGPVGGEEADISANDQVAVFPNKITLNLLSDVKNGNATLTGKASYVNLAGIKSEYPLPEEYIGPPATQVHLQLDLVRVSYDKIADGDYYDPITRTTEPRYRYERREENVKQEDISTDGEGKIQFGFPINQDETYLTRIKVTDADGRVSQEERYFYNQAQTDSVDQSLSLSTSKSEQSGNGFNSVHFAVGEPTEVFFKVGEEKLIPKDKDQFLFRFAQRGIRTVSTGTKPSVSFAMKAEDVPDIIARGVWFDGRHYRESSSTVFNYDDSLSALKLSFITNKNNYVPGDQVHIDISAHDIHDKPVSSAVNISVLDKALLALRTESEQILPTLYSTIPSGVISSYKSHQDPLTNQAEGGGGCFLSGTRILMADGRTVPIEQVKVGDAVKTRTSTTDDNLITASVSALQHHQVSEYLVINDMLSVTPEHLLFVNGHWMMAGLVKTGDLLLNPTDQIVPITSLERRYESVPVYNLTIDTQHTFFANGVYVHNDKGDRSVFKDVALFTAVQTDNNGKASVDFKLPDNITSWRLLGEGISADKVPSAGTKVAELNVSQSLFVDATLAEEYLTGDTPIVKVRAYGDGLTANQPVDFQVEVPGLLSQPIHKTSTAFTPLTFELPPLTEGSHQFIVTATSNGLKDKLTRKISVISSRLTRPAARSVALTNGTTFSWPDAKGPIQLTISDRGRAQVLNVLELLTHSWTDRFDMKLASNLAKNWISTTFPEVPSQEAVPLETELYQANGAINLFPHSDKDLYVSFLTAISGTDQIDKFALENYFYSVLNDKGVDRSDYIAALAGLGGLKRPVLPTLQALAKMPDLRIDEKIYLGLGLASLGDQQNAKILLEQIVSKSQQGEGILTLTTPFGPDRDRSYTVLSAALAANVNDARSDQFVLGALNTTSNRSNENLELAIWAKAMLNHPLTPAKITLSVNQKDQQIVLNHDRPSYSITVPQDQLSSIKVTNSEGNAVAVLVTETSVSDGEKTDKLALSRSYSQNSKQTQEFAEGQLVQVSLDYSIQSTLAIGCMQVSDWLPAGLAITTQPVLYGVSDVEHTWYPYEVNKQKISFCVPISNEHKTGKITYNARVVTAGKYRTEGALIQPMVLPGIFTTTQSSEVKITPLTE